MTEKTKIELRQIEIKKRMREISALEGDVLTPEIRTETDTLSEENATLETRMTALLVAEDEPVEDLDAEARELARLSGGVELRNYITAAMNQRQLDGRERELAEHRGLEEGKMPWEALLPRSEDRADAVTPAPTGTETNQSMILGRIFARQAAAYLGTTFEMVGIGATSFPVLTTGATAVQKSKDALVESAAGVFEANILSPKRLQAEFNFRVEDEASFPMMEESLRRDLAGAIGEAMDLQILTGNGTAPNVGGFLGGGLTAPTAESTTDTFATALGKVAKGADGRHAGALSEVRTVVGPETYAAFLSRHLDSNILGDYLAEKSGGIRVSALVPDVASDVQEAVTFGMAAPGSSVAAIWPSIQLLVDRYSHSGTGWVQLVAQSTWNFKIRRADAYQRLSFKLA